MTKENCVASIAEQSWLDNEKGGKGGNTEITCPDGPRKSYTHNVAKRQVLGGIKTIPNEEAAAAINKYLKGLVGGPDFK